MLYSQLFICIGTAAQWREDVAQLPFTSSRIVSECYLWIPLLFVTQIIPLRPVDTINTHALRLSARCIRHLLVLWVTLVKAEFQKGIQLDSGPIMTNEKHVDGLSFCSLSVGVRIANIGLFYAF
jgi:hypothetical protein